MGYNFKAPWKLAELERQDTSAVAQTTVSSSFRLLQPTGYCSVDLKLGNWSDLEDKLLGKFKDPGDYLMESSSSSGSSKRARVPSNGTQVPSCLVDGCVSDLSKCRDYHRRHKVCEQHSKTPKVFIKGQELRFCQQCSRFHSLVEFDEGKRSCRKRLDGHNRRRRKPQPDSLTVNSPSLFSHHQGLFSQLEFVFIEGIVFFYMQSNCEQVKRTRANNAQYSAEVYETNSFAGITYLQFGSSQVHPTTAAGSTWARADKSESNPLLYNSQSSLNISVRKTHFPGSLSFSYKGEKHFPFLQDASSTVPGESGQSNLDANSTLANSGSSQNMFSDGLMQVIDSDCALSLLSSPPADAREIGLSHMDMVQPDLTTPQAQSLIPSLNYDRLGAKGEPQLGSVLVSSGANNSSDIRGQNTFQTEGDVSSVSGSHQMISFSWG